MTELLRCPYCGSEVRIRLLLDKYYWECSNDSCSITPDIDFDTEQEAIDHANRRAE